MNTGRSSIAHLLAAGLLVMSGGLVGWNWLFQPAKAALWISTLALIGVMIVMFIVAPRAYADQARRARKSAEIAQAIVFAGLMLVTTLTLKLASALGLSMDPDLSRRTTMVLLGVMLASAGNAIPKTLTPLSVRCNPGHVQAFQRLNGWLWVITGVAMSAMWLALPAAVAEPVSMFLIVSTMLTIAVAMVNLRRARHRQA